MRRSALLILAASALLACGEADSPDVILITVDTLRADRVGCYGYASARTPVMDGLAAEGLRFEHCESPVPVTLPSHASILTGQEPPRHGVRNNLSYRLPAEMPTLAEAFSSKGYQTAAFVAAFPVDSRFGLDRGFDHYDDALPAVGVDAFHFRERPATEVVASALQWLESGPREAPVFVWIHLFEPHAPYTPEAPHDQMDNPYDGEIAVADAAIGEFLGRLDAVRKSPRILALTSDHGEGAGEHGEQSHALFLYESTLRVPLILHAPGIVPAGGVVAEPVGLIDVAPTLLSLAGLDVQLLEADGIPLPVDAEPERRQLYAETLYAYEAYGWSPMFALRQGDQKVIRSAVSRAFDLASDPGERVDLQPEGPEWSAALLERLDGKIRSQAQAKDEASRQPSRAETEALSSLGYVSATGRAAAGGAALLEATRENPDPTESLEEFGELTRAQKQLVAGEFAEATRVLRAVVQGNPRNAYAWSFLGDAYRDQAQPDSARIAYGRSLKIQPNNPTPHINLARLHAAAGRHEEAIVHFESALAIDPENDETFAELMQALTRVGRHEDVDRRVRQRMETRGESAELHGILARLFLLVGQPEKGVEHLARARQMEDSPELALVQALYWRAESRWPEIIELLTARPELDRQFEARLLLGIAYEFTGEVDAALDAYRSALALDGTLHLAHARVAWLLATEAGQPQQALVYATRALELDFEQPDYHEIYVEVLERLQMMGEARAHLEQARIRFPEHPGLRARAERLGLK